MTQRGGTVRRVGGGAVVAAVVALVFASLHAQAPAQKQPAPKAAAKKDPAAKLALPWPDAKQLADLRVAAENLPLFRSDEPLAFTLTSDFGSIDRDRDPNSTKRFPGEIQVQQDGGGERSIPLQVGARGHARRDPRVCAVVPLRLDFAKKDVAGTVFEGQRDLKLVTHCENNADYEQHVLSEYLAYRVFNAFTPRSFRARLVKVTYIDPKKAKRPPARYGILLENDEDLARRLEGRLYAIKNRLYRFLDQESLTLMTLLQYMIGNTDYSIMALHNVKLVQDRAGVLYPVTYDFDYSGLANTGYGLVDKRLAIQSVRDRLYRGPCKTMEELSPFVARFLAKKDEIAALVDAVPDMKPDRREDAHSYLGAFFATLANPGKTKRELIDSCNKSAGM